jgi:hypothetical protein
MKSIEFYIFSVNSFLQGVILVGGFERAFSIASQGGRIEFDK